jgi:hypothetical protein
MDFNKKIRYMADNSSVNGQLLACVLGKITSKLEAANLLIPCPLSSPISVAVTPLDSGSTGAYHLNGLTLIPKATVLADDTNCPAIAVSTAYPEAVIAKTDGKVFQSINTHTTDGTTAFIADNWKEIRSDDFLKLTFATSLGSTTRFSGTVKIDGMIP